jgi:ammonia channel protein AmtB
VSFADPQSVTVSGSAISLPRTSSGQNAGTFTSADGLTQLSVASTIGKRTQRVLKLSQSKISADPLMPTTNVRSIQSCWLGFNGPSNGAFTVAESKALIDALVAYLSASTGARVTQLLGGEN